MYTFAHPCHHFSSIQTIAQNWPSCCPLLTPPLPLPRPPLLISSSHADISAIRTQRSPPWRQLQCALVLAPSYCPKHVLCDLEHCDCYHPACATRLPVLIDCVCLPGTSALMSTDSTVVAGTHLRFLPTRVVRAARY
eukprot:2037394-Rhodomonas_salina.1